MFAKAVPIPLGGEDKGCRVEATLLTPAAELVLITGSGFASNSELMMDSNSEGERHSVKGKTDADGRYVSAIMPHKSGLEGGVAKVSLKAVQCAPSVGVQWGRRS